MRSRGWLVLGVGVALMTVASVWAPPQPELVSGGACNVAPCGTLEDPDRWRAAWWVWLGGAALALPAAVLGVRPSRPPRWPVLLSGVVVVPALLVSVALVAVVVSLLTSVQGAATAAVLGVVLPAAGLVSSWARGTRSSGGGGGSRAAGVGARWQGVRRGPG